VKHLAQRMQEELARPPTAADSYELVARRDAFLSLLSLCQPQLKPHLAFDQLLAFSVPVAALAAHASTQAPCVLLPVRLCLVVRSWCADIPTHALAPLLQLMQTFLQQGCPKAVRLATLGPLRELLGRFSDHEAWAQAQGPLIDGCLVLLNDLKAPEVQWRCLNLVHLFLCEEAESGRHEVTEHSLQRLLALWRQPDAGEQLICLALLDVLRALVLMSCRSRQPRLPLSPALLACCLGVVSDCYSQHRPSEASGPRSAHGANSAALLADASIAAGSLGDQGSSSATVFDSGVVLFLAVLRAVDASQAAPLVGFFPQLLVHYSQQSSGALHDGALDLLLEYCALYVELAPGAEPLQPHYASLLRLCHGSLQRTEKDRNCEVSFGLLQVLLAHAASPEALASVRELLAPLLVIFASSYNPRGPPSTFRYPLHPLLQVFCTWHARHPQDFLHHFSSVAGGALGSGALLVAGCRVTRPIVARASLLAAALALVEAAAAGGGTGDVGAVWRELLSATSELLVTAQRQGPPALLMQTLQALKSSLATKLPMPTRSSAELQACQLPRTLRSALRDDGTADEAAVVRWYVGLLVESLRRLGSRSATDLQALVSGASEQVRSALQAAGL